MVESPSSPKLDSMLDLRSSSMAESNAKQVSRVALKLIFYPLDANGFGEGDP